MMIIHPQDGSHSANVEENYHVLDAIVDLFEE